VNVSVSVRASVTAGFAKQVDGVKSMAAPTKPATAKAVSAHGLSARRS